MDSCHPAAPECLTKTEAVDQLLPAVEWPIPKPRPLAPEVSDDAGVAGGSMATAGVAVDQIEQAEA